MAAAGALAGGDRAEHGERLRLALRLERRHRLVLDQRLGRRVRRLPDHDHADRSGPEQARGRVDRVARHEPLPLLVAGLECDGRLAGVDRCAHGDLAKGVVLVELDHDLWQAQCRPDGALGVVLAGDRSAEHGHHGVTDELLDAAAVALDLPFHRDEVGAQQPSHVLRVGAVRAQREVDEVGEQDRDGPYVLGPLRLGLVGQQLGRRRPAAAARGRFPRGRRVDLARQLDRRKRLVAEARAGALVGRLADGNAVRRSRALELARDVDDVTGDRCRVGIDDHEVGVDPDPHGQVEPLRGVQLLHELRNAQGDAHCPLRALAVRVPDAEHRDDRIADVLLDAPAAPLHLPLDPGVERPLDRADERRVGCMRPRREADEVGVEHRDERAPVVHSGHCRPSGRYESSGLGMRPGGCGDSRGRGPRGTRWRWRYDATSSASQRPTQRAAASEASATRWERRTRTRGGGAQSGAPRRGARTDARGAPVRRAARGSTPLTAASTYATGSEWATTSTVSSSRSSSRRSARAYRATIAWRVSPPPGGDVPGSVGGGPGPVLVQRAPLEAAEAGVVQLRPDLMGHVAARQRELRRPPGALELGGDAEVDRLGGELQAEARAPAPLPPARAGRAPPGRR